MTLFHYVKYFYDIKFGNRRLLKNQNFDKLYISKISINIKLASADVNLTKYI